jgi:hypothetical protein
MARSEKENQRDEKSGARLTRLTPLKILADFPSQPQNQPQTGSFAGKF